MLEKVVLIQQKAPVYLLPAWLCWETLLAAVVARVPAAVVVLADSRFPLQKFLDGVVFRKIPPAEGMVGTEEPCVCPAAGGGSQQDTESKEFPTYYGNVSNPFHAAGRNRKRRKGGPEVLLAKPGMLLQILIAPGALPGAGTSTGSFGAAVMLAKLRLGNSSKCKIPIHLEHPSGQVKPYGTVEFNPNPNPIPREGHFGMQCLS